MFPEESFCQAVELMSENTKDNLNIESFWKLVVVGKKILEVADSKLMQLLVHRVHKLW